MAGQAEGAEIVQITLATTLGDRPDVVGIPERSTTGNGLHAIEGETGEAGGAAGALQGVVDGGGLGLADGADTAVAGEDLIAEVAGVRAEAPLMDAEIRAEGAAASGEDLEIAPATEGEFVRAESATAVTRLAAGFFEGAGWMGAV